MDESKTATIPTIGLTVDEVAKALRVDEKTVRKLIKTEGLPARLVGRGYRVEEGALRRWLAEGSSMSRGSVAEGELVQGGDPCNLADFRNVSKD